METYIEDFNLSLAIKLQDFQGKYNTIYRCGYFDELVFPPCQTNIDAIICSSYAHPFII